MPSESCTIRFIFDLQAKTVVCMIFTLILFSITCSQKTASITISVVLFTNMIKGKWLTSWLYLALIKQYSTKSTTLSKRKLWSWMLLKMHVGGSHFYGLKNTSTCCSGRNQTFITRQQDHHRKNSCATS